MAAELLLDAGASVALVDRDEKLHDDCVAALEGWTGSVVTTKAVLTEMLYLVGPAWRAQKAVSSSSSEASFRCPFVDEESSASSGTDGQVPKRPNGFRRCNFGCFG